MPVNYHPHWDHSNQELVQEHANNEDPLVQLLLGRLECTDDEIERIRIEVEKLYELTQNGNQWG